LKGGKRGENSERANFYKASVRTVNLLEDHEMNASKLIDGLVENLPDWQGATFKNIRRIIQDADPEVVEEWKWMGTPVWSHNGIVCIANAFKDKVKLTFYNGASLQDPDRLFNNELEGKKWRSIDFYRDDKIKEDSLRILVRSAVAFNQSKVKPTNKSRGNMQNKPTKRAL
jgi:hypothetical protein